MRARRINGPISLLGCEGRLSLPIELGEDLGGRSYGRSRGITVRMSGSTSGHHTGGSQQEIRLHFREGAGDALELVVSAKGNGHRARRFNLQLLQVGLFCLDGEGRDGDSRYDRG